MIGYLFNECAPENGMTINLQNKSYQEYFKKIKSWEYYFLPTEADYDKEIKEFYKSNFISVNQNSIATNKLNKPLALEIYTFYSKTKGGEAHIQIPVFVYITRF